MNELDYRIIDNTCVYGLEEAVVASGYPMATHINPKMNKVTEKDAKRALKLGSALAGSGHDCFLKGIIAQFDLTFTEKAWPEAERYHFFEFVSSMSTMHMLSKMDIRYISYTDKRIADIFLEIVKEYVKNPSEDKWLRMIYSYPSGLLLTARITTNYLQLKTIYAQRKTHRLPEWRQFCTWVEGLPLVKELGVVPNDSSV